MRLSARRKPVIEGALAAKTLSKSPTTASGGGFNRSMQRIR